MPSSSGSWEGGARVDIIDLDRYMRGSVRPSSTTSELSKRERLVVDNGGGAACGGNKARSSASGGDARQKRYSHDSGLSDTTIARHPRRSYRQYKRAIEQTKSRHNKPSRTNNHADSSSSLRAFRTVCEQALLDQQRQIARVTELCERLTERADTDGRGGRGGGEKSSATSDLSSSTCSTKEGRQRTKGGVKTYKIIMNKLDELNRALSSRTGPQVAPSQGPPRGRPSRPNYPPSSTSVSVCDKVIATEPQKIVDRWLSPTVQLARTYNGDTRVCDSLSSRHSARVPPRTLARGHPNIITERSGSESSQQSQRSARHKRGQLGKEDPVRLYSESKRLQVETASTRRTRSVEPPSKSSEQAQERAPTLCAVCRAYWRYLRQLVSASITQAQCM